MIMSRGQNAVRSHSIKTVNSFFEKVEDFIHLGTILTNKNFLQEGIKEKIETRECLLSFDAESFVFQFALQEYKD